MLAFSNLIRAIKFLLLNTIALNCFGTQESFNPSQLSLERSITDLDQWLLSWFSESSQIYFVQQSNDLVNWSWHSFHLPEEAKIVEESVPIAENRGFFRLQYTEFSATNTSPLLTDDFDGDSISNYDEINTYPVMGLDPLNSDSDGNGINDGLEDSDGDGQTNAFEFAQGRLPDMPDTDVAMYIDAALGSASYSGLSAVPGRPTANDGPKASIASGLDAAAGGEVILLQPGIYYETILSNNGKALTLRPNGPVTIR